ncbi:UDP-N-acetylmuramoyl-L-alanyl-D-glutamate--2,6-diaminopimelate ligase [candidate division KSB1 bacterium]
MKLKQIINKLNLEPFNSHIPDTEVKGFSNNSAEIENGFVFFAVPGVSSDGFKYAEDAVKKGAAAVIHTHKDKKVNNTLNLYSGNIRRDYSKFASLFYGNPSLKMNLTGITGTNGKTSTSFLIRSIFEKNNKKCGLLGTIFYHDGGELQSSSLTTPDSKKINETLFSMLNNNVKNAVMEVSSHSISQYRTEGLNFSTKVFTNISHDHLDYHGTFEEYLNVKASFFENSASGTQAVVNADDNNFKDIIKNVEGKILTYGINNGDVRIKTLEISIQGIKAQIEYKNDIIDIVSSLIGQFNLYNICAAFAVGIICGFTYKDIAEGIKDLKSIPGRMEKIESGLPFTVLVDYAHTPDAVEKALKAVRPLTKGRIISVLGCGGDRDREKRPVMGKIGKENSDLFIMTSDNPRTENPVDIINAMVQGIDKKPGFMVLPDREPAIKTAIEHAAPGDTVMILGKGHEDYQVLGRKKIDFDDRAIAKKYMKDYVL